VAAHGLPPLAGYPDDTSLQAAVTAFLARVTDAFHRAGKLVIANASNTYDHPGLWERWLAITDGLMEEHFAGRGWTWGEAVAVRQLEAVRAAHPRGKWVLCFTEGAWDDRVRLETSFAAYLLVAGPRVHWSYRPGRPSDRLAWHPALDGDVGAPRGNATSEGTVWRRQFERAIALVNVGPDAARVDTPCGAVHLPPREGRVIGADCAAFLEDASGQ
jgi:hypothetical protein